MIYEVDNDEMFMNVCMSVDMKMFRNVIKTTFHVDGPRFGGGVNKRVLIHLRDKNVIGKFTKLNKFAKFT